MKVVKLCGGNRYQCYQNNLGIYRFYTTVLLAGNRSTISKEWDVLKSQRIGVDSITVFFFNFLRAESAWNAKGSHCQKVKSHYYRFFPPTSSFLPDTALRKVKKKIFLVELYIYYFFYTESLALQRVCKAQNCWNQSSLLTPVGDFACLAFRSIERVGLTQS